MSQNFPSMLTAESAKNIFEGKLRLSLDLGLSETTIKQKNSKYFLNNGETINQVDLKKISQDPNGIYFVRNQSVFLTAIRDKHFFKLVKTKGAPTIEIDGIRMHRLKDTTPEKDAEEKITILGLKGGRVLDTCMGLGYTAIQAHESGAEYIISIEFEENVIRIAQINPWSYKLFKERNIYKIIGDSFYIINSLQTNQFDYIIHDPPRHSRAGYLYSLEFYNKLARVLKPNGKMFHYTGEPGSKYRRIDFKRGVIARLNKVGFTDLEYHPSVMGVTCKLDADTSLRI